jgi:Protein kinase domain
MIGTSVEHYQIVERLGQGGMGAVYRATDTLLEREVALKLLRPEYAADPQFAERFRAEAVTLAKLSHPNIATLYGFVRDSTQLCMVMELATGETLTSVLKRTGAMSWERAILLTGQMLDALQYAHERGVVHRDIKPSNLMVGQDDHLKLMDFGIARLMGTTRVTQMGFTVGTLEYMAPEQIRGEDVDGRADIYATGVVLYEMVTGQLPFKSSREQALMFAHLQQEVVPPRTYRPNLPWHLSDVIVRALAKAPGDRFASAREFSDALGASIGSSTVTVRVPTAGHTVTGTSASPRRRTAVSRSTATAGAGRIGDDESTQMAVSAADGRQGWLAKWWPTFRVSSNRFGGNKEPGVMYQAEVGAGGFGGAIRIVAVRMTTAGRRAASRVTEIMRRGGLAPAVVVALLLLIGGGWYWRQQRIRNGETGPTQSAAVSRASAGGNVPASAAGNVAPSTAGTVPASAAGSAPGSAPAGSAVVPASAAGSSSAPTAGGVSAPPSAASAASSTSEPPAGSVRPAAVTGANPGVAPALERGTPTSTVPAASVAGATAGSPAAAVGGSTAGSPAAAAGPPAPARNGAHSVAPTTTAAASTAAKTTAVAPASSLRGGAPAAREGASAPETAATAAPVPVRPAVPTLPDLTLENGVTLLTPKEGDVEETDGLLTVRGNEIVIVDDENKVLRSVRLRADGSGKGPIAAGPAQIYTHRRDRWLVVPLPGDRLVVQIDRDDVAKLIPALEARLGRPVTTVDGEPQFPKH